MAITSTSIAAALWLTLGLAAPLSAQSPSTRISFVDGIVFSDQDDAFNTPTPRTVGIGFAIAVGSEPSTIRLEFEFPQAHERDASIFVSRYFYGNVNPSLPGADLPGSLLQVNHLLRRTISLDLLYARHVRVTKRVQVDWLAGGGLAQRSWRETGSDRLTLSTGGVVVLHSFDDTLSDNHLTAALGLEIEILVARRLAVVPELRVHAYPGALVDDSCCNPTFLTAKPTLAIRWRF
jgi:hypothetical protein